MALPRINETPKYDLIVPSSQTKVSFRPFLTKEQKILLMALETRDNKKILGAITDTIAACAPDVELNKLTTFDVEYIFTQMRAKSVGERSKVGIKCSACAHQNEITIDLEKIEMKAPDKKANVIKLNNTWTLKLKYPSYLNIINNKKMIDGESPTETIMTMIASCLDSLSSEEENIRFAEETAEAVTDFIDNLNAEQFEKVVNFVQNVPKLRHDVTFKCESCSHENKLTLEGMNDFF
jgi:hypothetical protein